MIKEAIILAGGLGTRLRGVIPDLPKCMAPVNGKPFIGYVINHLKQQGIERYVFSLGYKHDYFTDYLSKQLSPEQFVLCIEEEPLGTGGAIKYAAQSAISDNVIVTNGDTLFGVDIKQLIQQHIMNKADCTLSLKAMKQFERYGVVEIDSNYKVTSFKEKTYYESGFINGGVSSLNLNTFNKETLPQKFSFEKDYLETFYQQRAIYATIQDAYFIDIGIPEDYERAAREL